MIRIFQDAAKNLIESHVAIIKAQENSRQISSLSESSYGSLASDSRVGAIAEPGAVAEASSLDMDPMQPPSTIDVVLPSVLMALLFVGNAIIVYVIFRYRKRKLPATLGEEMALRTQGGVPEV